MLLIASYTKSWYVTQEIGTLELAVARDVGSCNQPPSITKMAAQSSLWLSVMPPPPLNVFHLHVAFSVSGQSPQPCCLDPVSRSLMICNDLFVFRSYTVYVRNFTVA
jgi:hypothetical protein